MLGGNCLGKDSIGVLSAILLCRSFEAVIVVAVKVCCDIDEGLDRIDKCLPFRRKSFNLAQSRRTTPVAFICNLSSYGTKTFSHLDEGRGSIVA